MTKPAPKKLKATIDLEGDPEIVTQCAKAIVVGLAALVPEEKREVFLRDSLAELAVRKRKRA
jgi:hypothetical protein